MKERIRLIEEAKRKEAEEKKAAVEESKSSASMQTASTYVPPANRVHYCPPAPKSGVVIPKPPQLANVNTFEISSGPAPWMMALPGI
jgi:hypothetical protein